MKQKTINYVIVLMMAVTSILTANAQKTMDVAKFSRLDNDLMARVTKPVRDNDEGKLCALIRVVTNLPELEVRADALGIVKDEKHNGERWLYIPYGAKSISFAHQGFFPLLYQYPIKIDEGTVYELRLGSYETPTDGNTKSLNTQMFVLTHNPDNATVLIDDMEVSSEFGVFAAMMSKGEHKYKVTAPQYEDVEGTFELADQPVRETANLQPLFGTFQLQTQPESGFNVLINGKQVGTSPYKSEQLDPGSYTVRIEKENFYPKDTLIRLREGDNLSLTCTATSYADSLFYNRILGGRNISFGVNVGYVVPFASSSSGGGFTGSAINYGLGDNREDVSYSSQTGFTAGLSVDVRLYKNFYLTSGVNYTQVKYTNKFEQPINDAIIKTINRNVYQGNVTNNYKEDYTVGWLEIPILASYRFVLTKTGSLHLNFGPYFSIGLHSKMKLSGSSEVSGNIYGKTFGEIDYSKSLGTFSQTYHIEGDFNMYNKQLSYVRTSESGMNIGAEQRSEYEFAKSPYKRFNYGLKAGITYELRGFQIGALYSVQLSNMANSDFWESSRVPIMFNSVGANNMSGYKHRIHTLEIKLGYILRY